MPPNLIDRYPEEVQRAAHNQVQRIKECEKIETYRRHMSKWRNSRWNRIGRNPNFLKMNYLIARAKEEEKENELFTSVERLDKRI